MRRQDVGKQSKFDQDLQDFIDYVREQLKIQGKSLTISTLHKWLKENANDEFELPITSIDDLRFVDDELFWLDAKGNRKHRKLKSLEPYIRRAKDKD